MDVKECSHNLSKVIGGRQIGRAMAQAVSRRPPTAEARVRSRVNVGFVVDKVALGQVFLRVLRFSPVNFIPPVLHY
jgi:hypothetical protein